MTADEARVLQEKAIDRENVDKAIKIIDGLIKENAERGESHVYVNRIQLEDVKRLRPVEERKIYRYFKSQGFDVNFFSRESSFLLSVSW